MLYRTDEHRNPTAFTTALAREAGLLEGTDFESGRPFDTGTQILFTAKLLGDPIAITIRLINAVGFYTKSGTPRWTYIHINPPFPKNLWDALDDLERKEIPSPPGICKGVVYPSKRDVIGAMYRREGGTEMAGLFPDGYDNPL